MTGTAGSINSANATCTADTANRKAPRILIIRMITGRMDYTEDDEAGRQSVIPLGVLVWLAWVQVMKFLKEPRRIVSIQLLTLVS